MNFHKIRDKLFSRKAGYFLILGRWRGKTKEMPKKKAGNCRDSQHPRQHWDSPTSIQCKGERVLHVLVLRVRAATSPLSWERTRVRRRVTVFVPRTGSRVGKWRNGRKEAARSREKRASNNALRRFYAHMGARYANCFRPGRTLPCALRATRTIRDASRRVHGFVYGSQVFDTR